MSTDNVRPLTPLSFQILVAVADEPRHGYGIIKEIEKSSGDRLKSSTGTLYLAIERLEKAGLIEEESSRDPRRRYYRLTPEGRSAAIAETQRLATLVGVAQEKNLIRLKQLQTLLRSSQGR